MEEPVDIFAAAKTAVDGDRQDDYGTPEENWGRTAELWSAFRGHEIAPWEAAVMMGLVKVARLRNKSKRDNYVDLAGYTLIAERLDDRDDKNIEAERLAGETRGIAAMKLIYVSGPYSNGHTKENVANAIAAGNELAEAGLVVLIPHLNHLWEAAYPHPYEFWLQQDLELLRRCDAVLRLPGESPGADREVALAEELGLPHFEGTAEEFLRVGRHVGLIGLQPDRCRALLRRALRILDRKSGATVSEELMAAWCAQARAVLEAGDA